MTAVLTPGRALDRVDKIMATQAERVQAAVAKVHEQTTRRVEAILAQLPNESDRALIRDRYGMTAPEEEALVADEDLEVSDWSH